MGPEIPDCVILAGRMITGRHVQSEAVSPQKAMNMIGLTKKNLTGCYRVNIYLKGRR